MTDAASALRARIGQGSISLTDFMQASNAAYYAQGDVFGVAGDFITAPEISQCFGELIGLWTAVTWQAMGSPRFKLVECGPGRGTLMADALRAAAAVPGFTAAAEIHMVEQSASLRERQRQTLAGHGVQWHADLDTVPAGPALIIANEFLDALPIRQWQKTADGWCERRVAADAAGAFQWTLGAPAAHTAPDAAAGDIHEDSPAIAAFTASLARRLAKDGGAALLIDYGYSGPALGDSLQAVRRHRPTPVLTAPGECDLTAHVDFSAVAAAAAGLQVSGPVEQGTWLRRLGIELRAERLAHAKTPDVRDAILQGVRRLTDPRAMGSMFKVMALASPALPPLEGFI